MNIFTDGATRYIANKKHFKLQNGTSNCESSNITPLVKNINNVVNSNNMRKGFLSNVTPIGIIKPTVIGTLDTVKHDMNITITPKTSMVQVTDNVNLPQDLLKNDPLIFFLHKDMEPTSLTDGVKLVKIQRPNGESQKANIEELEEKLPEYVEMYQVILPPGVNKFTVDYKGKIFHEIKESPEDYGRSFPETPGIVSEEGIYLAGASYWYPVFDKKLSSFEVGVNLPSGWDAVSQGDRVKHKKDANGTQVTWKSDAPQDEIYLIGGKFTEYNKKAGKVDVQAFLRSPDKNLAQKYLEVTSGYMKMYDSLVGKYPYNKFAMVENFWETGYGMPSFTLLGPKIIRMPFILNSSYPHELLHNWWGNSVYVDYDKGNWCEGLTSYMADHLIQESRGEGTQHRRASLQRYTDYVSGNKDFPLTEFRSRKSAASEAVGYGKCAMFFHMLRTKNGDDTFRSSIQKFYKDNAFKSASWDDVQKAFGSVSKVDLAPEFDQWVKKTGAPQLTIKDPISTPIGVWFLLTAKMEQMQSGDSYLIDVPITVHLEGVKEAYQTKIKMSNKNLDLSLELPARPVRIELDPEYDLFRRLDKKETPPALSQLFGADDVLVVLPGNAIGNIKDEYLKMAEQWKKAHTGKLEIKWDDEVKELPGDRAIWLLGWENKFKTELSKTLTEYGVTISDKGVKIENRELDINENDAVFTAHNPKNINSTIGWVSAHNANVVKELGRKLSHYGKYSYLGFEGEEVACILRGEWVSSNSPTSVKVLQSDGKEVVDVKGILALRKPLAIPETSFSKENMIKDLKFLASEKLKGRGFGTPELDEASEYIAKEFQSSGLQPLGNQPGSFFKTWKDRGGDPEKEVEMRNVVGIIPGVKKEFNGESVVITAHFDHLGLGWPDAHSGDKGKIHPGADDNASGVSVLLELARVLANGPQPDRTIVFLATSGEEAGLRGSKHYVQNEKIFPVNKCVGVVNLDTVGRLGEKKLTILGTGSAKEWTQLFMDAESITGVKIDPISKDAGGSDQKSFISEKVPAVQIFSGANLDYHRPTDKPEKIDFDGLVKVASITKEVIQTLSSRNKGLTFIPIKIDPGPCPGERKATIGTVPDFSYTGKGYKVQEVVKDSPAYKAGMQSGDLIIRINNTEIESLRDFSDFMKKVKVGDEITVVFNRKGKEHKAIMKTVER